VRIDGAGHGDYWGHARTEAAARAADRIAEFFKFAGWSRSAGSRRSGPEMREAFAGLRGIGHARDV